MRVKVDASARTGRLVKVDTSARTGRLVKVDASDRTGRLVKFDASAFPVVSLKLTYRLPWTSR